MGDPYRRDAMGRRVPSYLKEVFVGRVKMLDWCRRLDRMKVQLAALQMHEAALHLDTTTAMKQLDAARRTVEDGMPFTTCTCQARQTDCEHCKGRRWVTRQRMPGRLGEVVA